MADVIVRSLTYKPTGAEIEPSPTAMLAGISSVPSPEELRSGHKVILTDAEGNLSETYLPAYLSRVSVGALEDLTTTTKTSLVAAINEAASTGGSGAVNIDDTTTSLTTVYSSSKVAELLAAKATNGLDYVATYETGDFNTLDFSRVGLYRVRGGTGYVTNLPSTSAQWWHVAVLYTQSAADANTTMMLATSSTSNTAYYRARYGSTWGSWLAWTTYSAMSVAEGTAGTATTSRVLRADYLKQIILTYLTGSGTTSATPLGQSLVTASDAGAARTLLGTIATEDPRLSDARTPTAHTHVWADLTDKPTTFAPSAHTHAVADITGLSATLTDLQTAVDGKVSTSDPRLTDARTPVAHTHPVTDLTATGRTTTNYLRGDGTWATPTNTTYSNISTAEITASGTTQRTVTGDLLKQAVRYWTTGSLTTANSAFGQSLNTAADAAAARTVLGVVADTDPRLTDARTPTAHTHAVADVTGLQVALDGKASTTHVHDWASITSKPTTFAPAAHVHDLDDLNISGTPSATTYLRGDGTWATPAGTGGTQGGDITSTQILDSTNVGRAVLTAATAEAARTAIGAGTSDLVIGTAATEAKAGNWVPSWADVTGKPATYPPDTHTHTAAQISDATTTGRSVLTAANASAARTAIGAGTSSLAIGTTSSTAKAGDWVPTWTDVTGKPTTFTPAAHTHLWADITDKPTTFTPVAHTHAIADVTGLQTALDGKAASTHTHTIANVTGLQTALDGKAPASHTHLWADLTDKPTTFPPSTHTHVWADITNPPATYTPTAHTHVAADISNSTTVGRSVLTATDAAAARTAIGAGTSSLVIGTTASTAKAGNYVPAWSEITSKPTTFTPAAHVHPISEVTSLQAALDGKVDTTDSRLTDARTPTAHTHSISEVTNLQTSLDNKVDSLRGAVVNNFLYMSTESGKAVTIPYFMNDIAYNNLRGGSTQLYVDGEPSATSLDVCFEPTSTARSLPPTATEYVVEVNLWKTFTYGTKVGFAQMESWRAQYMKIEARNKVTQAWITCYESGPTDNPGGDMLVPVPGNSSQGIDMLRYTFRDFVSSSFRIGQLFLINYSSEMGAGPFLPRGGGEVYGNISGVTPTSAAHLTRKDYVDNAVAAKVDTAALAVPKQAQANLTGSGIPALTGAVDGTNKVFTVPDGQFNAGTVTVFLNGVLQVPGEAVTWNTATGAITFVTAPATDDQIFVAYQLGGNGGIAPANSKGHVVHGSNSNLARPTGYASVEWIGTVAPANAIANDTWVDIS